MSTVIASAFHPTRLRRKNWVASLILSGLGAAFPWTTGYAQRVETAFVFKYDVYDQAANGTAPLYAGTMISAGFQLADPITVIATNNTRITGPAFGDSAALLSASGLTTTTSGYLFRDPSGVYKQSLLDGTFHFQFLDPSVFDDTIELSGNRYPAAVRISNLGVLQAITGDTTKVDWARLADATPGDQITVSVSNERREEVFSTGGVTAAGVEDENATTAQIFLPPGRTAFGTLTVTRVTATNATPAGKLIAGYATSTTFSLRSIGPLDTTAPQPAVASPPLDAVGIGPTSPIELTFDEPMRRRGLLRGISTTSNTRQRLEWSADQRRVRITFPDPLPAGPLTLRFGDDNTGQAFQDLSSNRIAAGTTAARFFVGNLPFFSSQPASQTLDPGTNVKLTATVVWPLGGLSYQWFRDGASVPGATNASLDLSNFQMPQAGLYELRAANANGISLSAPALVVLDTLRFRPRGSVEPSPEAVYPFVGTPITPGLPFTLRIRTENDSAPLVQWRKDGRPIAGATSLSLDFASLQETDTGLYDALLTNAVGTGAATEFPLVVRPGAPLPNYKLDKEDISVPVGLIATLAPLIQPAFGFVRGWQLNGKWVQQGGLSPIHQIFNVSSKDEGVYRYVVSNGLESVVAAERTLSVRQNMNPPFVSLQPRDVWFDEDGRSGSGGTVAVVEGAPPMTYQWRRSGVNLPGVTGAILDVTGFTPPQAGPYTCVARNAYGSTETRPITVSYRPARVPPEKPRIVHYAGSSPLVIGVGDLIELQSGNEGLPGATRSIMWRRNGLALNDTNGTLRISGAGTTHAGFYTVLYGNDYGATESDPFEVRIIDATQAPYLTQPKLQLTPRAGEAVYLNSPFIVRSPATYRWFLNGRDVTADYADSSRGSLTIASAQTTHIGTWSVEVTNAAGIRTAPVADLTLDPGLPASARLINLSTRATAGQGAATLIVGFGLSGTAPKRMLLRAVGPRLASFGIATPVRNPRLIVYRGDTMVATNDDWARQSGIAPLVAATEESGAFTLGLDGADAALAMTLAPGSYTIQYVSDSPSTDAIGLIEAYDLDPGYAPTRLTNLSSRLLVGPGEQAAIPGLTVRGSGTKTYLVRAIGPGLAKFGVTGVLADPKIVLAAGNGSRVAFANDDWATGSNRAAVEEAAKQVGAFALDPTSKDAALLVALPANSYTALVSGANNASGIVLVEVYELP